MSYSRWINSQFYTYWCSAKVYDKQDELFACHTSIDNHYMFTYTEVTKFIEAPDILRSRIRDVELSDADLTEITGYMKEFIKDVDIEYNKRLINLRGGM